MAAADASTGSIEMTQPIRSLFRSGLDAAARCASATNAPTACRSSRFSIQVQTAFEGVMGGIADENANNVCSGDQFSPQGPFTSHLPIPGNMSGDLSKTYMESHTEISHARTRLADRPPSRGRTSSFMCLEPCSGSHWQRSSVDDPDH